ncbi:hypothetical protein PAHAL_5G402100 [Panicum hallii]|uniref:Secreted protein n=1 Tax=Panicum hallii TaxID=206008 RepID=A0A2T8IMQ9_9POAL|nr:hypothetical protein PAHAL_5G402100 [Panicum hallii]
MWPACALTLLSSLHQISVTLLSDYYFFQLVRPVHAGYILDIRCVNKVTCPSLWMGMHTRHLLILYDKNVRCSSMESLVASGAAKPLKGTGTI